jgi:hypothetical protein
MTILRNKFFVGEPVYCAPRDKIIEVRKIFDNVENTKLTYGLSNDRSADRFLIVDESVLFESKEAYEKEKNQIREGDEFYVLDADNLIIKLKADEISSTGAIFVACRGYYHMHKSFKTKEQLLAAVQKAVEECEG